ncbi:Lipoprotein signal peptidase [Moorella thermoacetica]|uniref:Lipoprotein signal peptidase n=1 Tax=Neomoorella thermoacetica TaxID=1525 RepID=A0AAC9HGD1_NEOTH|nr:signal peptidase II [Moorella thermoacetica]AOQ23178.1 lipoprotein signal peptidase [Moorella thermoacetica]TYL12885.1 Lipoprotein signal peptidase [Moorella thermoacetica]
MQNNVKHLCFWLVGLGIISCDQIIKMTSRYMIPKPITILGGISFGLVVNPFCPFGPSFPDRLLLFAVIIACVFYLARYNPPHKDFKLQLGTALAAGGTVSNGLSWLMQGYVVDYILLPKPGVAANLADIALFGGIVFICFGVAREIRFWLEEKQYSISRILREKKGAVLPLTLIVIVILSFLITAIYSLVLTNYKNATYWDNKTKALYLAESGINDALYHLIEKGEQPTQITSDPAVIGNDASYSVQLIPAGSGKLKITSTGTYRGVKNTASLMVYYVGGTLFPQAIVDLSALPGEEGYFEGYQYPAITFNLPPVPPGLHPETLNPSQGVGPGDHWFTSFELNNNKSTTITGPANIYVTGDFQLDNNASLKVNGQVTFYISGDLQLENNSSLNLSGTTTWYIGNDASFQNGVTLTQTQPAAFYIKGDLDAGNNCRLGTMPAANLIFYLTIDKSHDVDVNNNAAIKAGLFNATGQVNIDNNATINGGVVGQQVSLKNHATVNYDESLKNVGGGSNGTWKIQVGSWAGE